MHDFYFFFFWGGGGWRDLSRTIVVRVSVPFFLALLELFRYSELEMRQGGKRGPRRSPSCHPGQGVCLLVSRRPSMSLYPCDLRTLILVGEMGNHTLNLSGSLLARPSPRLSCAGNCAGGVGVYNHM
jgi:hypothetical protein